ncbi:unnamed protein product [Tilletia controversa]|nr:unnamed protein product [Tilletia controversa]CAD6953322.1 unnamed protein product [Tilletia controversa]
MSSSGKRRADGKALQSSSKHPRLSMSAANLTASSYNAAPAPGQLLQQVFERVLDRVNTAAIMTRMGGLLDKLSPADQVEWQTSLQGAGHAGRTRDGFTGPRV